MTIRLDGRDAEALALLARRNGRSAAGELRYALDAHIAAALNMTTPAATGRRVDPPADAAGEARCSVERSPDASALPATPSPPPIGRSASSKIASAASTGYAHELDVAIAASREDHIGRLSGLCKDVDSTLTVAEADRDELDADTRNRRGQRPGAAGDAGVCRPADRRGARAALAT